MEYVQMTLDEWINIKQKLRQELIGVKRSFVRIGYMLRKIDDQRGYEQDGYRSIAEFAQKELGLHPSTTTRFMEINREYSIDGYSERLREEYEDLSRSQLEEMLKLPENDRQMIQPETSREDIRDLKRFNKTEPAAGEADDLSQLIEQFFHDNRETLNTLFQRLDAQKPVIEQLQAAKEIINPSGNRSYRKGMFFLMMYDNRISVKKFGDTPRDLTWEQFLQMAWERFLPYEAGEKTWENYFGEEIEEKIEDEPDFLKDESAENRENTERAEENKKADDLERRDVEKGSESGEKYSSADNRNAAAGNESSEKESKKQEEAKLNPEHAIAPAQKSDEYQEIQSIEGSENLPGQMDINDFPELIPDVKEREETVEIGMNEPEILEKPFGSRKDWLESLTIYGAATEIALIVKAMLKCNPSDMTETSFWENWLKETVDDQGRTMPEV